MAKRSYQTKTATVSEEADFELSGVGQLTGQAWSEEFRVLPSVPAGVLDDLMSSMVVVGDGQLMASQPSVIRFFRAALIPGDVARFVDLMNDQDRGVDFLLLTEIMTDLAGDVLGFPMPPQSDSGTGLRRIDGTSTAV